FLTTARQRGRPPLTRRSRWEISALSGSSRSTSAHAEEPAGRARYARTPWVDLRSRGGALDRWRRSLWVRGRPPLTRRSRARPRAGTRCSGSTSAHAEEPPHGSGGPRARQVDLRSRGGADKALDAMTPDEGRPPLTRRSLPRSRGRNPQNGSTSAHAEEPEPRRGRARPAQVDLRSRGGAQTIVRRNSR